MRDEHAKPTWMLVLTAEAIGTFLLAFAEAVVAFVDQKSSGSLGGLIGKSISGALMSPACSFGVATARRGSRGQ